LVEECHRAWSFAKMCAPIRGRYGKRLARAANVGLRDQVNST
jgi:hypothetical protein